MLEDVSMSKFWVAVASREHVLRGIAGGFCQVCHGKAGPLKAMSHRDWIVYYSPTEKFGQPTPCRKFTAIGTICEEKPYSFQMSEDFIPWRRNVLFHPSKEAEIVPLIGQLSFISDKQRWGFPFRRGCFSIPKDDFLLIARQMEVMIDASL